MIAKYCMQLKWKITRLLQWPDYPEDGGSKFLWNVSDCSHIYVTLYPRRHEYLNAIFFLSRMRRLAVTQCDWSVGKSCHIYCNRNSVLYSELLSVEKVQKITHT